MLAIIPARGGSKGLPNKNIKLLNGKPLLAYSIEAALSVNGISKVFVSTDDQNIAKIAIEYGADCSFLRPSELASDTAKSIEVYKHVISEFSKLGQSYNEVIILQPTSPLRTKNHIIEAVKLFYDKKADSVVSYCEESHPIVWNKHINSEGKLIDIFGDKISNRQEELKTYYPNGSIYIFRKHILEMNTYYTDNSYAYIMERKYSIDIDTQEDFDLAHYYLNNND